VGKTLLNKYGQKSADTFLYDNGKGSGTTYHLAKPEFSMQLQGELQYRSCTGFPAVPDSL